MVLKESVYFRIIVFPVDEKQLEHVKRIFHSILAHTHTFDDNIVIPVVNDLLETVYHLHSFMVLSYLDVVLYLLVHVIVINRDLVDVVDEEVREVKVTPGLQNLEVFLLF